MIVLPGLRFDIMYEIFYNPVVSQILVTEMEES